MTSVEQHHDFQLYSFPPMQRLGEPHSGPAHNALPVGQTQTNSRTEDVSPKRTDTSTPAAGSHFGVAVADPTRPRSTPSHDILKALRDSAEPLAPTPQSVVGQSVARTVADVSPASQPEPNDIARHAEAEAHSQPYPVDRPASATAATPKSKSQPANLWEAGTLAIDPTLEQLDGASVRTATPPQPTGSANPHVEGNAPAPNMRHTALWPVQTSFSQPNTQPSTSVSETSTPPDSAFDMFTNGGYGYDLSRQSSSTNLSSYVGHEMSDPNAAPSLTGYEQDGSEVGGDGVPPPKPKKSHARKQPQGHIKRARNAFILFRKHITDSGLIPPSVEVKHQNISVVAAKMWREAPQEVRQKFQEQARIEKEEHQRKYPGYRYQPVFRRTDIVRRRVRKDAAEDERVEAVAEALIQGKHGDELEAEIRTQMQERVESSASEPEPKTSRRRRRDVGQLSKGALRAQRAQNRARQIRQNLLGSSLLNLQLYNQNQLAAGRPIVQHPGSQHMQYAAHMNAGGAAPGYMPVAYGPDGRPVVPYYGQEVYADDGAYRVPGMPMEMGAIGRDGIPVQSVGMMQGVPHDGMGASGAWGGEGVDYWNGQQQAPGSYPMGGPHEASQTGYLQGGYDGSQYLETDPYRLPPLAEGGRDDAGPGPHLGTDTASDGRIQLARPADIITTQYRQDFEGTDAGSEAGAGERDHTVGQQTPSGHVMFSERLFDGALGSAMFPREDGLGDFGEAVTQANELDSW